MDWLEKTPGETTMTGYGPESLLISAVSMSTAHRSELEEYARLEYAPGDSLWVGAALACEAPAVRGRASRARGAATDGAAPMACSAAQGKRGQESQGAASLAALPSQRA